MLPTVTPVSRLRSAAVADSASCCARVGARCWSKEIAVYIYLCALPSAILVEDGRLGKQRRRLLLGPEEVRLATCHAMQPRQVLRAGIRRRLVYRDVHQCHEPESRHQVSRRSVHSGYFVNDVNDVNIRRTMLI